jgi:hypothetical protein
VRKDELEAGVAYATKHNGKVTVVQVRVPGSRMVRVQADPSADAKPGDTPAEWLLSVTQFTRRWDHPEEVAEREAGERKRQRDTQAMDLAERLGFTIAHPGDGWEAHRDAEARISYPLYGWPHLAHGCAHGCMVITMDAWLRIAPHLDDSHRLHHRAEQDARDRDTAAKITNEQAG